MDAGKSRIKALVNLVSGKSPPPGLQKAVFMLCPHKAEGLSELQEVSFIRAPIPFARILNHLLKAPPTNTIKLDIW